MKKSIRANSVYMNEDELKCLKKSINYVKKLEIFNNKESKSNKIKKVA